MADPSVPGSATSGPDAMSSRMRGRIDRTDWRRRRAIGLVSAVVLPALVTALLTISNDPTALRPATWYLAAVVVASLVGGVGALAVSTVVAAVGLWYSVSTPPHSFGALEAAEWWGIAGFVIAAGATGLLVTRLESALRERDTAVEARVRTEAEARARQELDDTRAELYVSELRRVRARRNVDTLQEAMLPHGLPVVDGFELDACYTPASPELAVGGDWYDAFLLDPGTLAFAVGDVSGHGVDAAALMAQLRNALRAYALEDGRPAAVLSRLNCFLCRLDTEHFATAVYGTLDLAEATCTWSMAGHPAPVLFGPEGARMDESGEERGPLLGFRPTAAFGESRTTLAAGDGMLFYTDGLVERRGEHIDAGTERLRALVAEMAGAPIDQLCDQLLERSAGAGGHEGRDDVCQLLVRRTDRTRRHTPATTG